uniref:Uncharacterized protein n=1 Tax=Timema genevievae TaxID=629358 RepID=A0A7R9K834_TIMGE|nr:unnamed protein product [Timema genevievae]
MYLHLHGCRVGNRLGEKNYPQYTCPGFETSFASSERELGPEIRTQTNVAKQDNKENVGDFSNIKSVIKVSSVNRMPAPDGDCKPYRRVNFDVKEEVNAVKRDRKPARTLKSCTPLSGSRQGSIRDPLSLPLFCARARETLARVVVRQRTPPPPPLSVCGRRDASVQTPSPGRRRSDSHVLGTPTRRLHACRRLRPDATPRCVPTTVDAVRRLTARPSFLPPPPLLNNGVVRDMGCNTSKEAVQPVEDTNQEEDKPREEARTVSGVTGNKVEEEIDAQIISALVGSGGLRRQSRLAMFAGDGKFTDTVLKGEKAGGRGEIKDLHHCSPRACADDGTVLLRPLQTKSYPFSNLLNKTLNDSSVKQNLKPVASSEVVGPGPPFIIDVVESKWDRVGGPLHSFGIHEALQRKGGERSFPLLRHDLLGSRSVAARQGLKKNMCAHSTEKRSCTFGV